MPRQYKKLQRLFTPVPMQLNGLVDLEKDQAHYLGTVLRKEQGAECIVFNGIDGAWRAEIVEISRKRARVQLHEQIAAQPAPTNLWFGFAPLKTARLDYVVQKATEMGAAQIQPVLTQFTQTTRLKTDKLHANIVEAAEQCEILQVPTLHPACRLHELLEGWTQQHKNKTLLFADEAAPSASPATQLAELDKADIGVLIGPEGGFSDEERQQLLAQTFVKPISLGPRILRADTAAVAALAVVQSIIGDWR